MKKLLSRIWFLWEFIFEKATGIKHISNEKVILRIAIRKYHGKNLVLSDGTALIKGDKYGELHLDNKVIFNLTSHNSSSVFIGISGLREIRRAFKILKEYINTNPDFKDINVFIGYTLLNRGINKLGFEVIDIKSSFKRIIFSLYEKLIIITLHPEGAKKLYSGKNMVSKLILITRKTINDLY